jgi:aspartate--ammonia ligase
MLDKKADLAGPGVGDDSELEKILPQDYSSLLSLKDTQRALFASKQFIEDHLCQALNLMMVTVPLIFDTQSGINDLLDRDGSRTPIQFHISNDHDKHPVDAQIVQAATKWKRVALKQFGMPPGEGLCYRHAGRPQDYFLDPDHNVYVDQWDWERVIHFYETTSISSSRPSTRSGSSGGCRGIPSGSLPGARGQALSQSAAEDYLPRRGRHSAHM